MRTFIRRRPIAGRVEGDVAPASNRSVPAAAYVRMSTDNQRYSVDNQLEAINSFAQQRGFEIVEIYADLGKSGISLQSRTGLQKLLVDVEAGGAPFEALLVYDVSRWGRFQDPDEAAAYELSCRRAGIVVHYCVEPFENDGSLASSVIKAMKRAMAGEYSRDLSARVYRGQARVASLGFRVGGRAGLGFRRLLMDEQGNPRCILEPGQCKAVSTDRVVLVQGPQEEVNAVRRVFRLFVSQGKSEREIVRIMDASAAPTGTPLKRWTPTLVNRILRNEKYIGNQVWARTSLKLKSPAVVNPPDQWIRCDGAYPGIVSADLFERAQRRINATNLAMTDEEMLSALRDLLLRKGYLSGTLVDAELPFSTRNLRYRFGGLLPAYERIGYRPESNWGCVEELRRLRNVEVRLRDELGAWLSSRGYSFSITAAGRVVRLAAGPTALVKVIRAKEIPGGLHRWFFYRNSNPHTDLTALACARPHSTNIGAFYIIPRDAISTEVLRIGAINAPKLDAFGRPSLEDLGEALVGLA